jgi:hypothetical protein
MLKEDHVTKSDGWHGRIFLAIVQECSVKTSATFEAAY